MTVVAMKVFMLMIKDRGSEYISTQMEVNTQAIGIKTNSTVMVFMSKVLKVCISAGKMARKSVHLQLSRSSN